MMLMKTRAKEVVIAVTLMRSSLDFDARNCFSGGTGDSVMFLSTFSLVMVDSGVEEGILFWKPWMGVTE